MIADDAGARVESMTTHATVRLAAMALLVFALAAAVSVDVVRGGYRVKSDEATYVAMALSVAYDGDLVYERRDLERFWGLYQQGPEGIFLKTGKRLRVRVNLSPPFVHVTKRADLRQDRLYFAKSIVYAVCAAPFVRLLGLNGFFVFHVLLLALSCMCGYLFLRASSRAGPAFVFALGFVGAAVVPIYGVFLMPDLFNFAVVFVAYFCWVYKEVARPRAAWLAGPWSDIVAAALIGLVSYSKVSNAPLIVPIVLLMFWRREWMRGVLVGGACALVLGGFFGLNALVTGEFNYQGGDRKTFYGSFPFESTRDVWHQNTDLVTTNDADSENVLAPAELANRLALNAKYFLIGRHFGLVPYFFPGVVALLGWAASRRRFDAWRLLALGGVVAATLVLLLFFPYTWSGGGGPPGNRYFLGLYPVLFFLLPSVESWQALLAVAGGVLFTAKILVNPFVSAKNVWEIAERGFARRLPVELTMANDLPVMLAQPPRGHIPYGRDPEVLLYFLDAHAFPPELVGSAPDGTHLYGMWVSGGGRADVIVRSERPLERLDLVAESPIRTTLTVSAGGARAAQTLLPGIPARLSVPTSGVRGLNSYAYLLSMQSSEGFTPRLRSPLTPDDRNLGAMVRLQAVEAR